MKPDKVRELLEQIVKRLKEDEDRILELEKQVAELKGVTRAGGGGGGDGFFTSLLAFDLISDIFD